MSFKAGILILGMASMAFSQITEGNDTSKSVSQTTTQTSLSKAELNTSFVKNELGSAVRISQTGAVLYGVGAAVEVTGLAIGIGGAVNGDIGTAATGSGLILAGGLTNFTGNIIACAGGSKARRILRSSGNIAPPYYGWGLFWGSLGLSLVAGFVSEPAVNIPLNVGSLALSIGSVVSAVRYAKKANMTQISSNDFSISPVLSMSKDKKMYGLVLNAGL
jgi:hypothetical protein